MKKKIIYGLLLAGAMVTASSSFVSCKDYEGDNYAELKNKDASLEEILRLQQQALENCSTNCANQHALLWAEFQNYQPKGDYALKTDLNNYVSKAKFTTDSTALSNAIKTNATAIKNLEAALKNYVTLEKFTTDSTEFMRLINQNTLAIASAKALAQQAYTLAEQTSALAKSDSVRIDGLTENYNTLNTNFNSFINAWGDDLASAIAEVARVRAMYSVTEADLNSWNTAATNAQNAVNTLNDNKEKWNTAADNAQNAVNTLNANMEKWNNAALDAKSALDSLAKYQTAWNLAAINAQEAKDSLNKYQAAWNNAVTLAEKANDFIGNTSFNNLQELVEAYKGADEALANDIAGLQAEVDKLKNTIAKMITGVIIQGTYSPVLGNGSLPLGIQTNVLAAYASKSTANVDFPSIYDEDYADSTTVLTAADQAYLQGLNFWPGEVSLTKGQWVISNQEGNAGQVYLTVNPTNVNFEGTNFDLVNSKGQISRMQISDLKSCDEVLNFGWTRSGVAGSSSNGFYAAKATVAPEDITKLQANINTEMFQKAFKEQLHSRENGTGFVSYAAAKDLARAVYSSLEPLQRFGVRAEWQDEASGVTRAYTSAYDLAATVVNPLGFGFKIPDSKYTRLPVFDTNYLKNKFHIKAQAKTLVVTAEEKATGKYSMWLVVDSLCLDASMKDVYKDANGQIYNLFNGMIVYYDTDWHDVYRIYGNAALFSGAAYINLTPLVEEIYGQINTSLASINDVIAQANKRIDYVVSYIDRYNSYATKVNKFIRNANNLLQPVLLWCDGQNVGQLGGVISGNYAAGTMVPAGGAVALVPTTYTLELLAPAYKKSVVCTNVYKDGKSAQGVQGDLETALKAINDGLKKGGFDLYEGQSLKNAFIFDAKSEYEGMTFEFAYTALDYTGQIAGRKFYLTVGPAKK